MFHSFHIYIFFTVVFLLIFSYSKSIGSPLVVVMVFVASAILQGKQVERDTEKEGERVKRERVKRSEERRVGKEC